MTKKFTQGRNADRFNGMIDDISVLKSTANKGAYNNTFGVVRCFLLTDASTEPMIGTGVMWDETTEEWIENGLGESVELYPTPGFGTGDDLTVSDLNTGTLTASGLAAMGADVEVVGKVTVGQIWHAYGGFEDEAYGLAVTTGWTIITNADNTLWGGNEADGMTLVDDQLIITNAGDYTGSVTVTLASNAGRDFHIRVYNVTQARVEGFALGASTTGTGNKTAITLPLYLEASAGDVFEMQMQGGASYTPTIHDGQFVLTYLHD